MAASRRPGPRGSGLPGTSRARPPSGGTRLYAPGPVGTAPASRRSGETTPFAGGAWFRLEAMGVGPDALFTLSSGADGDLGYQRVAIRSPEQAAAAAQKLVANDTLQAQLREMSGLTGDKVAEWTERQLLADGLRILWRSRMKLIVSAAPPPPAPPPPVRAAPAPAPPSPSYATFPPDLDAVAVSLSLISAAKDGVPFCEECMKARATPREDGQAGAIR